MAHRGRPSKLTPECARKLIQALRAGNYRHAAAKFAGISQSGLRDWCAKGRKDPESEHGKLLADILEAESEAVIVAVGSIRAAGSLNVDHYKWWLERKHPEDWGRNRLEVKSLTEAITKLSERINVLENRKRTR